MNQHPSEKLEYHQHGYNPFGLQITSPSPVPNTHTHTHTHTYIYICIYHTCIIHFIAF
jgi:hypothetical protein